MKKYNHEWHNDECVRSQEHLDEANGYRCFYCKTHNQWAAEVPVESHRITTYSYGDGTTTSLDATIKNGYWRTYATSHMDNS